MILQVFSDIRIVVYDRDTVFLEMLCRTNSTTHEELRRSNGSTCHKNFATWIELCLEFLNKNIFERTRKAKNSPDSYLESTYSASIVTHQIVGDANSSLRFIKVDPSNHCSSANLAVLPLHSVRKEGGSA
jgi:hypothetical protein